MTIIISSSSTLSVKAQGGAAHRPTPGEESQPGIAQYKIDGNVKADGTDFDEEVNLWTGKT